MFPVPTVPPLSFSSCSTFGSCRRRWLYRYGSAFFPEPLRWEAKRLGRLAPWTAMAGRLVDETISVALREFRARGQWPQDLQGVARGLASEWWRASRRWVAAAMSGVADPPLGRFGPLDRHYLKEEVSLPELDILKARVREALENFLASPFPEFVTGFGRNCWRGPRGPEDRLGRLRVGEAWVWAVQDFAIHTAERVWILDWKCGALTQSSYWRATEQLTWYALQTMAEDDVVPERIRLVPVWLWPQVVSYELEVTPEEVALLRESIADTHRILAGLLALPPGHLADPADWPLAENRALCRTCPFRSICEGALVGQSELPAVDEVDDPFSRE